MNKSRLKHVATRFQESQVRRYPKGDPRGGQFAPKDAGADPMPESRGALPVSLAAKARQSKAAKKEAAKLSARIDRLETELERLTPEYLKLRQTIPNRKDRENSPLGQRLNALYAERNDKQDRLDNLNDLIKSTDIILRGVESLPKDLVSALVNVGANEGEGGVLNQSIRNIAASIIGLEKTLSKKKKAKKAMPEDYARMRELTTAVRGAREKLDKLRSNPQGISAMAAIRGHLISVGQRGSYAGNIDLSSLSTYFDHAAYKQDIDEFMTMTNGKGTKTLKRLVHTESRAHASRTGEINVGIHWSEHERRKTFFHEMGHHVEFSDNAVRDAAAAWVRHRATGPIASLNEISNQLPDSPPDQYDSTEIAYSDEWISPYVGKVYGSGLLKMESTEVISMGIQHFTDPAKMWELYVSDPEHFWLTIGAIRDAKV
jgi:hypothetical protein